MRQVVVAGVVIAGLATVGCGKGGSAPVALSGSVNDHGSKTLKGDEIEVEQDDLYFNPTYIKASPGATVKVELKNEGKNAHTFTIDALGVDQTVPPGQDATVNVTLPQSGAVSYYCKFHKGQGMQGAFYFHSGDTVAPGGSAPSSGSSDNGGAYGK